jgi:hypothetical protein
MTTTTLADYDRDEIIAAIPFPVFRGNATESNAQIVGVEGDMAVIEVNLFGRTRRTSVPLATVRGK